MFDKALAVTEVSSRRLSGKPPECGKLESNWRAIEEFLQTRVTNVSQSALFAITLGYFPTDCRELNEGQGERFHQDIRIIEQLLRSAL